ncbi:hypothetical protein TESG_07516 [Trichophyton tonsurans CBS 112818]|uniref:MYB DNA-binding domain-containing protein n=1 Tax=Trichophyton tonsurans (strain CBS 112818) TaxID=647933 RepID=F2S9E7_TRIT1|nr:hypothetical protein TESG_07516 [Trichophyton tonsurans CBS 112818]
MNWVFPSRSPLPDMNSPHRLKTGVGPNPPALPHQHQQHQQQQPQHHQQHHQHQHHQHPIPLSQTGAPSPFAPPNPFDNPMVPAPPVPTTAPAPSHLQTTHVQQQQQQPGQVHPPSSPANPRKRRASIQQPGSLSNMGPPMAGSNATDQDGTTTSTAPAPASEAGVKKKGRTNTPWTAEEEQRLKTMRDAGNTWSEIAKTFPTRTEGSVKKHWYKDMHYAEFAEDESIALRDAIKEYESNKWKVIGQKVGKPAKACEQYAKEHFKNL